MEKRNPYVDKMFAGIKERIIDNNALFLSEISEVLQVGGNSVSGDYAAKKVSSGEWEQVWKRGRNGLQKAYRPAKK